MGTPVWDRLVLISVPFQTSGSARRSQTGGTIKLARNVVTKTRRMCLSPLVKRSGKALWYVESGNLRLRMRRPGIFDETRRRRDEICGCGVTAAAQKVTANLGLPLVVWSTGGSRRQVQVQN